MLGDPILNPNIRRWIISGQQIMIKIQNYGYSPESKVFFRFFDRILQKIFETNNQVSSTARYV